MLKRFNKYKTKESMKKVNDNLDKLKGENPFKVPEGYMEGLTDLIMSQLPEKSAEAMEHLPHSCITWFFFTGRSIRRGPWANPCKAKIRRRLSMI